MSEQVNKEQTKDAKQETITELPEGKLEEVVGGDKLAAQPAQPCPIHDEPSYDLRRDEPRAAGIATTSTCTCGIGLGSSSFPG